MGVFTITDFGAVGDGVTLNTIAIQKAIDTCSVDGGGKVVFPKGVFISGNLEFKGNITYLLERGAVLKGAGDMSTYCYNGFWHNEFHETLSFIWARNQKDFRITGDGTIDLSSEEFFKDKTPICGDGLIPNMLTKKQLDECVVETNGRPNQPLFFESCEGVEIDTIKIINSPCWTITFSRSRFIKIHNITVMNSPIVPNCDGIHLSACKDAVINDCIFYCGDDCIAITCITAEGEQDISERIVIKGCVMFSRSAAVRLGHAKGKVRHIVVSDLVVTDSNRGIAIFAGNDGWVEDVVISNISMETRIVAGGWWGKGEAVVICAANSEGHIDGINIRNVRARCEGGIIVAGKNQNVRNINISDFDMTMFTSDNFKLYGGVLDFRPNDFIKCDQESVPYLFADSVEGLVLRNITCRSENAELYEHLNDLELLTRENVETR